MIYLLTRSDKRAILGFLTAGLIGLILYITLYDSAFPTASLNLKISRQQAVGISRKFLESRGHKLTGYQHTIIFQSNDYGKEYLERNLGLRRANELMSGKVKVWYWSIRWFKPMQEEEFHTKVGPSGELVGYRHTIPEKRKDKNLPQAQAKRIALSFLGMQGVDATKYFVARASTSKLPNRTRHFFEWEEKGFRAAEARNRIMVAVDGDAPSHFGYYIKMPEDWLRKTDRESGQGDLLMTIATVFYKVIIFGSPIVFLFALRARAVRWLLALLLSGILVTVDIIASLNSLPMSRAGYSTTETMSGFWSSQIMALIGGIIVTILGTVILASSADVMARWTLRGRVALSRLLTGQGLLSVEFVRASLIGFGLGLAQLGYVSVFYVVAMKYFHAWSPASVPYSNILSTALPWIYPLTIGISAAVNEELGFRLFAVSALKRYARFTWIAVVVPALVWAFLHSNYPQVPAYVRGIEISVVGLVLGIVFLRYGIVATLVSHYTYNSIVSGTLLLRSDNTYFRVSGLAVMGLMLLPLIPAAISCLRRNMEPVDLLEPEPEPKSPKPSAPLVHPEDEMPRVYVPLSRQKIIRLLVMGIVAMVILLIFFNDEVSDATSGDKCINRSSARKIAEKYMAQRGIKTDGYICYSEFSNWSGGTEDDYLVRHMNKDKAQKAIESNLHDAGWTTYWFKPLDPENYDVTLDPNGKFYSWSHEIKEKAPGPKLSPAQARPIAEEWLKAQRVDLTQYRLVNSGRTDLDNRTDHWFAWEKKSPKAAGASFRVSMNVQGNVPMGRNDYIDIPDEYYREQEKTTTRMSVCAGIAGILSLLLAIWLLVIFVQYFVAKRINWRLAAKWGALVAVLMLISGINDLPTFYSGYSDTDPLSKYITTFVLSSVLSIVGATISVMVLIGMADALYRRAFPGKAALAEWFGRTSGGPWRMRALQDGIIIGITCLPIMGLGMCAADAISAKFFPSVETAGGPSFSDYLNCLLPMIPVILMTVGVCISIPVMVAGMVSLARTHIRRIWLMVLMVCIFTGLSIGGEVRTWPEFWQSLFGSVAALPLVYVLVRYWCGHNAYAYIALFFVTMLCAEGSNLMDSGDMALRVNGIILVVTGLAPLVIALYAWLRDLRKKAPPPPSDSSLPETVGVIEE